MSGEDLNQSAIEKIATGLSRIAGLITLSDLELATRGGNELDDDTNALRALQTITA